VKAAGAAVASGEVEAEADRGISKCFLPSAGLGESENLRAKA